jgi:hypothetical protein
MLAEARQYHILIAHPWILAPGLASVPLLLGYLTLADVQLEGRQPNQHWSEDGSESAE